MSSAALLEVLASARQIATHAERLGITLSAPYPRQVNKHLGAVLADAILQAGLNYRTVVRPRIDRICIKYPDAARLSGVKVIIDQDMVHDFLLWKHDTKTSRFTRLAGLIISENVEDIDDLRHWLEDRQTRDRLLNLNGVGPKTFDYICCLVGIDRIPIDRHIIHFAGQAGVSIRGYDDLQAVMSYAADLLGIPRRDFDTWIWKRQTGASDGSKQ